MAEDLASTVSTLYEQVEMVLTQRIRQAAADGIDAPTWVEQKLASLGNLQAGIRSVVDALSVDASGAIHQAVTDAYRRGQQAAVAELGALPAGVTQAVADAIPNAAVIDRLAAALVNDTRPVHLRILRESMDTYRDVIARASAAPLSGAQTRRQAAQSALDDFANRGVTGFVDRSGRSWNLSSYIEMATRSTVGRAAIEAHTDRLGEAGVDLVIVSRAPEECPLCRRWETKILVRSGQPGARTIEVEHATEDERMVKVRVAGSLEEARAAGLMHPNCRHTISAYLPGLTKEPEPVPARGTYEQSQQQRYLERQVRKWKRLEEAATDDATAKTRRARVRAYQAKIRELVDESGMPRKPRREQLAKPSPQQKAELGEQQPVTPPEPQAVKPPAPPEPQARVSQATRDRIEQVRRELPKDRSEWVDGRFQEVDNRDLIARREQSIANADVRLEQARADREEIVRAKEAEFRARRTPKAKRSDLLAEATRSVDDWIASLERGRERDRASLEELRNKPPEFKWLYRKQPSGELLPPKEYEQHLDRVLDAGQALEGDLRSALDNDQHLAELREKVVRLSQGAKPDADELRAAQAAVAAREAETVRRLVADVRKLGGRMTTKVANSDFIAARGRGTTAVREDWEDVLDEALGHFPREWLDRMRSTPLVMVGARRAHYQGRGGGDGSDLMALDTDAPTWYNGAFSSYAAEVATHELGHRMEQYVPGLRELEYTLVRRRAMFQGVLGSASSLQYVYPGSSYRDDEMTYRDRWADAYAGKTYEAANPGDPASVSSEVFQVGLQDLFGRSGRRFDNEPDLQRFVLGCLALL
ncbi:phage minor capsid protein [Streptomyces sp. NPDC005774]|uniref:phage minor capsid protein n=1 Tax=Streptomyces sp. NPDC005774 TaxID=3364728 RepID=UPI0036CA0D2B